MAVFGVWRYPRCVSRHCYRVGCHGVPVATLVYDYAHSTATLYPLSPQDEPSSYDLCLEHSRNLQVPTGWSLDRVTEPSPADSSGAGWLASLADEVRSIGWRDDPPLPRPPRGSTVEGRRRGHLHVITDASDSL